MLIGIGICVLALRLILNVSTSIFSNIAISLNDSVNSSVPSQLPCPLSSPCVYTIAFMPCSFIVSVGSVVSISSVSTASQFQKTLSTSSAVIAESSLFFKTNLIYLSVVSVLKLKSA